MLTFIFTAKFKYNTQKHRPFCHALLLVCLFILNTVAFIEHMFVFKFVAVQPLLGDNE